MTITYRAGVDIGGTFTDIVLLGSDGTIHTKKISSSVENYAQAIVDGLDEVFRESGLNGAAIEEIRHGTTVASNAILEHKGARVGLITTKGFRDVLEIRTLRMPKLYDLAWTKPAPLVERYLRQVVDERIDHRGHIDRALDPADAERAVDALLAEKVEAIAVCLLNSFTNPVHEAMLKDIIVRKAPHLPLSISFEVLPEIKEYERTSTTVINAYVMPIVATYLRAMRKGLDGAGIPARLLLMQSNGGLTTDAAAAERPMNIIESGPAGGVVGAQALARAKELKKIITFDMGGTTAKASMVEDGEIARAQEYAVGAGIMIGSRLLTGAGYTLKVPAIDLAEVGAGGGSHVWIDAGGALQAGPESAGASPGPVCYDMGGETPTITDANVLLGYINPAHLVGGALKLNAEKARAAFAEKIAKPLGMTIERAAYGAHLIAASNMIRAIKAVSTERGRDPREFALFAFGGNGPLFAAGMAAALGITASSCRRRPACSPRSGCSTPTSSITTRARSAACCGRPNLNEIAAAWDALARQANEQLAIEGFAGDRARLKRSAALHYKGQSYELTVPVPDGPIDERMVAHLEEAFGQEHEKTYGHRAGPEEPVELVAIQLVGSGLREGGGVPERVTSSRPEGAAQAARKAYFGAEHGWRDTPVLTRSDLGSGRAGPLIVEEYDATCVVPPGRERRARRRRQYRDRARELIRRHLRQPQRDLRPDRQDHEHQQHGNDERRRADDDVVDLAALAQALHHVEIDADRRRDHRQFHQNDDDDAEPDRIVAGLEHDRRDDRHRRDHHRQCLHEHAEDEIENHHGDQQLDFGKTQARDETVHLAGEADRGDDEIEEVGGEQDRHDHGGGAHRAFEGIQQRAHRKAAVPRRDANRRDDAERRGFGRGRPTRIDRSDDRKEDDQRRQKIGQRGDALCPACRRRLAAERGPDNADEQHGQAEQARENDAGDESREIELRNRCFGEHAVHDHVDRRRDEDAERAAGRDGAEEQALRIAALLHLAQRHRADRGRRRDARPGGGREHRAGRDVRMHQPAGQPRHPQHQRVVHALGHARAQQDFAEQHEERNRDEQEVVRGAPGDLTHGERERQLRIDRRQREAEHAEAGCDRNREREKADENEERDPEHVSCPLRASDGPSDRGSRPRPPLRPSAC